MKPCARIGCRELVKVGTGRCQKHQAEAEAARKEKLRQHDRRRGSSTARGYDAAWRRVRDAFLAEYPLCQCEDCQDGVLRITAATVVDHIIPISEQPGLRLEWSNLRSMAKACHDKRTLRDQVKR